MITGKSRLSGRARSLRHISSPEKPGNIQSSMTRSGGASERRKFSLVAAIDMLGDEAFRLEIINQQHRQRGLIFNYKNARRAIGNRLTQCGGPQFIHRTIHVNGNSQYGHWARIIAPSRRFRQPSTFPYVVGEKSFGVATSTF